MSDAFINLSALIMDCIIKKISYILEVINVLNGDIYLQIEFLYKAWKSYLSTWLIRMLGKTFLDGT